MKKIKIFVGTREISGYFGALKEGFKNIGYYCKFYDLYSHPFSYKLDDNDQDNLVKILANNIDLIEKNKIKGYKRLIITISTYFLSLILLFRLCFKFDIFILHADSGFWRLKPWDYSIIKFFRKKLVFVSLGTDIRPPYLSGKFINNKKYSLKSIFNRTKKISNKIKKLEKYADLLISYPAHSQLLNKNFINGLLIGNPSFINSEIDYITNSSDFENGKNNKPIKIIHAPSDILGKGTIYIRQMIEKIKIKGFDIDYIEVINKPHDFVIEKIKECDFVIDQLYSDTPLPLLSVEAALLKKPSVICGYYRDYLTFDLPENYFNFPLFSSPEIFEKFVEELCRSKELRIKLGNDMYNFLLNNWAKEIVAQKYIMIINNSFPEQWIYKPDKIEYIWGYGINKNDLINFLKNYIDKYGENGLFLRNKIKLIEKIKEIAK